MYAIISELDADSAKTVRCLWRRLRDACGLEAIYNLPTPHLTWLVSEDLDIPATASIITHLAALKRVLTTYVFGLGIFSGQRPVLYLPIVKTQAMIDLHHLVWDGVQSYAVQPNQYYAPDHWLPHITLAVNDLSKDNLACALESVTFETIEMPVKVDNLIIVAEETDPSSEYLHRYRLSGL
jgi:2'-5' RNA ligase